MARLFGAQRLVLQAIQDSPKDAAGLFTDIQVAQSTNIALKDVRDWIETLEGEGLIEVAPTITGLSVLLTAAGRLRLSLYQPKLAVDQPQAYDETVHGHMLCRERLSKKDFDSNSAVKPPILDEIVQALILAFDVS